MKNYVLYILMRNDLPSMSTGRAMAQASHASNAFIQKYKHLEGVKSWQRQTTQGFGTAIVLSANIDQIFDVESTAIGARIAHGRVIDPDYVFTVNRSVFNLIDMNKINHGTVSETDSNVIFISKREVTCFYIFGEKETVNKAIPQLGQLTLHP